MSDFEKNYEMIHAGEAGYYKMPRGLFEVSGDEAVQFLDGLTTNDVKKLEDGEQMLAAFPTAKGRLFAIVRVKRIGDKYLFETEDATREKVFENLFRFTFAGDFHVAELSDDYQFFRLFGEFDQKTTEGPEVVGFGRDLFVHKESVHQFVESLKESVDVSDDLYEVLRIEYGVPEYGVDMSEETVVPEVGLEGMISYEKGCYIGQEVIARIHFRGKPAKRLSGLEFEGDKPTVNPGDEVKSIEGKNAGVVTSITYSPKLGRSIGLGYIRNAYLEKGAELCVGEYLLKVCELPFIE